MICVTILPQTTKWPVYQLLLIYENKQNKANDNDKSPQVYIDK